MSPKKRTELCDTCLTGVQRTKSENRYSTDRIEQTPNEKEQEDYVRGIAVQKVQYGDRPLIRIAVPGNAHAAATEVYGKPCNDGMQMSLRVCIECVIEV
ncbi:hypothetical protein DPMN_085523 [Dreissena polymorpha]|uniref:Uncharacterized protein n=1 Tax=Dreissena polymorpha TaxID=45954 RepID=A0A9D3YCK0_DREPO|nr:hypothetical protein DPMN_085523 [Dreissena polymorpha]